MYKKLYRRFLDANPGLQHYAAHSHHFWPDVTREATLQYWDDSAKFIDDKWEYFFTKKVPEAQKKISQILNLKNPEQIVFAPNTHEFVTRLFSCFEPGKKIRVLTTDSEFYSFNRQADRLAELENVSVTKVATAPFDTFAERFISHISKNSYELIFLSQVFFNSGFAIKDLNRIVAAVTDPKTLIVIDGYHGFMALPTDLSAVEDRVFYVSGSYKYAQGGEGCCFMTVPRSSEHRPLNTGWFASFESLASKAQKVEYSQSGYRFAGSTMDFTALYRLLSVLELFETEGISVSQIHSYVHRLQIRFLDHLDTIQSPVINRSNLLMTDHQWHGHFLTFDLQSEEKTKVVHQFLKKNNVWTDFRGTRLRFGFGLYHDDEFDLSCLQNLRL